jgi:hypothetical protein
MIDETGLHTPLLFGKNPTEHTKQLKGATLVALIQFGNETVTHELTPFDV